HGRRPPRVGAAAEPVRLGRRRPRPLGLSRVVVRPARAERPPRRAAPRAEAIRSVRRPGPGALRRLARPARAPDHVGNRAPGASHGESAGNGRRRERAGQRRGRLERARDSRVSADTEPTSEARSPQSPGSPGPISFANVLKHTGIYGLGNVGIRVAGLLLVPLYTYNLSPAEYGVIEYLDLTAMAIGMLFSLGLANAIYRFYYLEPEGDRRRVVSTALLPVLAVS